MNATSPQTSKTHFLITSKNVFIFIFYSISFLLGSKTLGLNVLEIQFVMLANYDQNVLVLFRPA